MTLKFNRDCTESADCYIAIFTILIANPWSWKVLPSSSVFNFSAVFYRFHRRSLSSTLLGLFLGVFFFYAIVNRIIFLILSHPVHYWYIEKVLIFVC
jgi:hypothetical protein